MAERHPYISGTGGITAAINQFRNSFPATVNAETLKKLGIAPNNESYLINILRFIGAIDEKGSKTAQAASVFSKHSDDEFQKAFEEMIRTAYGDLFALHTANTWNLSDDKLISFFRTSDQTSDLVGRRQASTFRILAAFAGHGEPPAAPKPAMKQKEPKVKSAKSTKESVGVAAYGGDSGAETKQRDVGLTVRIEVNLPPQGDQETYDRIFRSIRENLLNAK